MNSKARRVVQTKIAVTAGVDISRAIEVLRSALEARDELKEAPTAQIGVHEFTYGGIVLGIRYWVPSTSYYEMRYKVNHDILEALREAGVQLLSAHGVALAAHSLSGDEAEAEERED